MNFKNDSERIVCWTCSSYEEIKRGANNALQIDHQRKLDDICENVGDGL